MHVNDSKLCSFTFDLFINQSSVRNNLGALILESARNRNRLLVPVLLAKFRKVCKGYNWDKVQQRLLHAGICLSSNSQSDFEQLLEF